MLITLSPCTLFLSCSTLGLAWHVFHTLLIIVAFLQNATIEYSSEYVCVCVCVGVCVGVCVCVCVFAQ